jgi:hypothetical protein
MSIAKGGEHLMARGKMVDKREICARDGFFNKALESDVVREPYVMRFRMEDFVGAWKRTVEIREETLALREEFRAGAPFAPVRLI